MNRREFNATLAKVSFLGLLPSLAFSFNGSSKVLIVYYTRTLNTHILSLYLQSLLKCDSFVLKTKQEYPKDYEEMVALAAKEREQNILVELESMPDIGAYTHIFVGTPLWGLHLSSPLRSFLLQNDFRDKFLIPFCTNAGWGFGNALSELKNLAKNANFISSFAYESKFKEKTKRDLRAYNQALLNSHAKAFDSLQNKDKIKKWLDSAAI